MTDVEAARCCSSAGLRLLAAQGWLRWDAPDTSEGGVTAEMDRLADSLGERVSGRAGALEEVIHPIEANEAHPRSLSARFGLDALPLHVELSHRPRPCRYLLLGCLNTGTVGTVTLLLDWRALAFSTPELDVLAAAPILVRSGKRSFYSTILSQDRSFLRYDPGCLEPVDERGRSALRLLEGRLAKACPRAQSWKAGEILVIDNWRFMHGRGPGSPGSGRCLARILIDA
jgi:hypothetical protein